MHMYISRPTSILKAMAAISSSRSNSLTILLLAFSLLLVLHSSIASPNMEDFSEELLLRPLPDGKVLAHFHFTHRLPPIKGYGLHHRLFPKAIFQLIMKFRIREMELSFTQGRWNYNRWGGDHPLTRSIAKPSGVEMWAAFAVPDDQIDRTWGNLTHALSGLFCASLNFLESPQMTADPVRAFEIEETESGHGACDPELSSSTSVLHKLAKDEEHLWNESRGAVRYGALPREAVCTENLTPWLKLLPCRDKAGFATLFDRSTIYKSWYHSLRLRVSSDEFRERAGDGPHGTVLQQTLTLVIEPSRGSFPWHQTDGLLQPSWSLSSLFGRDLFGGCPLAKFSSIYMEFDRALMEKLNQHNISVKLQHRNDICVQTSWDGEDIASKELDCSSTLQDVLPEFKNNHVFVVHGESQDILVEREDDENVYSSALLTFDIPKDQGKQSVDIGLTWKIPVSWDSSRGPFRVTRFLVGSGNERGAIALVLNSNTLEADVESECQMRSVNTTNVLLFQVVPWYIRIYFHTLKVFIDRKARALTDVVKWMKVVPSEDRLSPGVMEMELMIPCNANDITLMIEFDKGFLRIDEHPPDANRGFDLPSALLHFSSHNTGKKCYQHYASRNLNLILDSPLLREFQKRKSIQAYTESLLVPLATPDFSMPYNVITLTCTILALYFGSLLKVLRQRIGEEERLANKKDASESSRFEHVLNKLLRRKPGTTSRTLKIIKFVIVAVIAVIVNYYLSSS